MTKVTVKETRKKCPKCGWELHKVMWSDFGWDLICKNPECDYLEDYNDILKEKDNKKDREIK